jgi:TusA-related sulfurtransferase
MVQIRVLDCLGALCPTPIIELSKAMRESKPGEKVLLKADDPATLSDLRAWSRLTGHTVVALSEHQFEITST